MNMGGSIHGGAVMSFIDMAMFAGGLLRRDGARPLCDARPHHPFPRARPGRERRSMRMSSWSSRPRGHAFLQGVVKQDGEPCYSFTGTLEAGEQAQPPGR